MRVWWVCINCFVHKRAVHNCKISVHDTSHMPSRQSVIWEIKLLESKAANVPRLKVHPVESGFTGYSPVNFQTGNNSEVWEREISWFEIILMLHQALDKPRVGYFVLPKMRLKGKWRFWHFWLICVIVCEYPIMMTYGLWYIHLQTVFMFS